MPASRSMSLPRVVDGTFHVLDVSRPDFLTPKTPAQMPLTDGTCQQSQSKTKSTAIDGTKDSSCSNGDVDNVRELGAPSDGGSGAVAVESKLAMFERLREKQRKFLESNIIKDPTYHATISAMDCLKPSRWSDKELLDVVQGQSSCFFIEPFLRSTHTRGAVDVVEYWSSLHDTFPVYAIVYILF